MKSPTKTLPALIQDFFQEHLPVDRNASPNTIATYRDAMKLFLRYASSDRGCSPDQLDHTILDPEVVRAFLGWLQRERACGPRTCNHRLAVLKSFAHFVAWVAPEHLDRCRRIRAMRPAKFDKPEPQYLEDEEVSRFHKAIDVSTAAGVRDRALHLLLYNTGARVQEAVDLNVGSVQFDPVPIVRLQGKGRKQRTIPLSSPTVAALKALLRFRGGPPLDQPLFLNLRGHRLTRSGVAYVLKRTAKRAGLEKPRRAKRITPHVLRHTTAMHLLQANVDITTIAAWLGHAQLSTTHGYVEIDLRMKQAALAATVPPDLPDAVFPPDDLITWLERLGRRPSYAQSRPRNPLLRKASRARDHTTTRST